MAVDATLSVGVDMTVGEIIIVDQAISTINEALENVSVDCSKFGLWRQNWLEHIINNLETSAESPQNTEARFVTLDMLKRLWHSQ